MENNDKFDPKKALLLAGKMATAATRVVNCICPSHYSMRIDELEKALNEYNEYIFKYPKDNV